jgi:hypothetical protein
MRLDRFDAEPSRELGRRLFPRIDANEDEGNHPPHIPQALPSSFVQARPLRAFW